MREFLDQVPVDFGNIPQDIFRNVVSGLKGQRIFLTGGTGFFGKSTLSVLRAIDKVEPLDLKLTLLTRNSQKFKNEWPEICHDLKISFVDGDISDFSFPKEKFNQIWHFATPASLDLNNNDPLKMLHTITYGSKRILEFCVHSQTQKFLLTSSGAVYGTQPTDLPQIPETYLGGPDTSSLFSAYAEGKRYAELEGNLFASKYGFEHKVCRCFAFVGPFLSHSTHFAIGNFIKDAITKNEIVITGDGSPLRSYLYADDLVFWLFTVLFQAKKSTPYNVGSDQSISILQLAEKVKSLINPDLEIRLLNKNTDGRSVPYVPSVRRSREELALGVWTDIDEAILKTASFYRKILLLQ